MKHSWNGFPVLGEIHNRANAGFFAVETGQDFINDGSDPEGILQGKYAVNNVECDTSSIYFDKVSGILSPGETIIKDILGIGDLPTNYAIIDSFPSFNIWHDYLKIDYILNDQSVIKCGYFFGGYPLSASLVTPPSGDFLFGRFASEFPRFSDFANSYNYNNPIISSEFGTSFVLPIKLDYDYNIENKELKIFGGLNNEIYNVELYSICSSISGITEHLTLKNNFEKYEEIKLTYQRGIDNNFNINFEQELTEYKNINMWTLPGTDTQYIKLLIEKESHQKKLKSLKSLLQLYWNDLVIEEKEYNEVGLMLYHIEIPPNLLAQLNDTTFNINPEMLSTLTIKKTYFNDNYKYDVLVNNLIYLVFKSPIIEAEDDIEAEEKDEDFDIYDWGIIDLPKFDEYCSPIFNTTVKNGKLVYGINVACNIWIS